MTSSPSPAWEAAPSAPAALSAPAAAKPPVFVWLVPVAAVLAVIGAILPWFHGKATQGSKTVPFEDSLHSWDDGKIGLLPPILLVVLAVSIIGLITGKMNTRFHRSSNPVRSAAKGTIIAGAISLICVVVAWFLVPSQYKFDDGTGNKVSWNDALKELHDQGLNVSFSRGPQFGYFLTGIAAVVAIVAGVLMLLAKTPAAPAGFAAPGGGSAFPPPGYSAPAPLAPPAGSAAPAGAPAGAPPASYPDPSAPSYPDPSTPSYPPAGQNG